MPSDGSKMSFEDVIVFIVGGGNYSEYQHLQVYAKSQNPARVILYGSTDICPANQVELGMTIHGVVHSRIADVFQGIRNGGWQSGGVDSNRNIGRISRMFVWKSLFGL